MSSVHKVNDLYKDSTYLSKTFLVSSGVIILKSTKAADPAAAAARSLNRQRSLISGRIVARGTAGTFTGNPTSASDKKHRSLGLSKTTVLCSQSTVVMETGPLWTSSVRNLALDRLKIGPHVKNRDRGDPFWLDCPGSLKSVIYGLCDALVKQQSFMDQLNPFNCNSNTC